jgi:hypothetical protein
MMALGIPEAEIQRVLVAVECGDVTLTASPDAPYAGVVEYAASNGWRLAVFNDCNEWDYLEWIEAPDGRRVSYEDLCAAQSPLAEYEPTDSVAREQYGLG